MNIIGIDIGTTTLSASVVETDTGAVIRTETLPGPGFLSAEPWARLQDADEIDRMGEVVRKIRRLAPGRIIAAKAKDVLDACRAKGVKFRRNPVARRGDARQVREHRNRARFLDMPGKRAGVRACRTASCPVRDRNERRMLGGDPLDRLLGALHRQALFAVVKERRRPLLGREDLERDRRTG